ncbi:MAG: putative selenate ABC transporter substrate-binding protein [Porticoccaceae bacterium]|nr:putative selenate ABC transporter substrate-binding protein [Porticoccaceae bacterium]
MPVRLLPTLVALLVSFSLVGPIGAESFTFTAIPDQDASRLQQRFGQVASYLQEQLGVEVNYIPVKSYAAAVTAFRNNQVQLAWFGALSGVQARQRVPGSRAIAQGYEDQFFKSYFIAHRSSGLLDGQSAVANKPFPLAMAGHTFTFGAKGSTSGRLMPEYYIRQYLGQAPQQSFRRVGFSGDHTRTIALVASGAYEVGAVNYQVWQAALAANKVDLQEVQVIWQTPTYPDYQWSIRGDVDRRWGQGFSAKVKTVLLAIKQPELLGAFPRSAFVEADNADYEATRETAIAIGLIDEG